MTQAELANLAVFSERLVVKAESGKTVSRKTLEGFALALSSSGQQRVSAEDLTSDPLALARRYTQALYSSADAAAFVEAIRDFLAEDVTFVISGDPAVIPFAGKWRGVEEITRGFSIFFSILEAPQGHDSDAHYRYVADGNDVVVWGDSYLHPKRQPMPEPMSVSRAV